MEYTRLDGLIEILFTAAADVEVNDIPLPDGDDERTSDSSTSKDKWQFTDSDILQSKREEIVVKLGERIKTPFIRKSRATYWSTDHRKRMVCSISKRYKRRTATPYWYAYHPQWDEFLKEDPDSVFVLGCIDLPVAFSIPRITMEGILPALNTTGRDDSYYWHIHISEKTVGQYAILLPKRSSILDLGSFRLEL